MKRKIFHDEWIVMSVTYGLRWLCLAWGVMGGTLVLLAWRYVIPPQYGELVPVDKTSVLVNTEAFFTVTSPVLFHVVPAWITFLVIGLISGVILGFLLHSYGLRLYVKDKAGTNVGMWLLCAFMGFMTGIISASVLYWSPPLLYISSRPAEIVKMPYQLDLSPTWLVLPVLGLVLGCVIGGLMRIFGLSIVRTISKKA